MSEATTEQWGVEGQAPDMGLVSAVTFEDVRSAATRIAGKVTRTPVLTSDAIDGDVGASVFFKCESLQRMGAFKLRGAMNAMSRLSVDQRARGVITYSSGNHAQGIALSAAVLGVRAVIVMPVDAPRVKLERTRGFLERAPEGSRVELFDPCEAKREELGRLIAQREGLTLIPPYDHPDVIAGQGTAAMELIEDAGELDALFVCTGGGGLLSGSAVVARALQHGCRVIGVEPALGDDAARSFRDGVLRTVRTPATIADGARTPYVGRYTLPLILAHVDDVMTVSEAEISRAMRRCMSELRIVVEPSGGLGLAGLLKAGAAGATRIGVIISGGNVDLDAIPGLLAIGLA
jgi:threonine dehydratase